MSPIMFTKTTTRVISTVTITITEKVTLTLNETALNSNNCPDNLSQLSRPNPPFNTTDDRRVFKLPKPILGSEEMRPRKRKRKQGSEPLRVMTGLRGRPKVLPWGTTEWLKLNQNDDIFCHPTDAEEDKVRFKDALPPSFFRIGTENPNIRC